MESSVKVPTLLSVLTLSSASELSSLRGDISDKLESEGVLVPPTLVFVANDCMRLRLFHKTTPIPLINKTIAAIDSGRIQFHPPPDFAEALDREFSEVGFPVGGGKLGTEN